MTVRLLLALLCFTAITAERATAQDAVLPRSDGQSGLCAPFGCETRIQQVFDAAHHPHAGRRQTPGARVGRNRDGFTTAQKSAVRAFVNGLAKEERDRIIPIGF